MGDAISRAWNQLANNSSNSNASGGNARSADVPKLQYRGSQVNTEQRTQNGGHLMEKRSTVKRRSATWLQISRHQETLKFQIQQQPSRSRLTARISGEGQGCPSPEQRQEKGKASLERKE